MKQRQSKWILRQAFARWLPNEITQQSKQGFGIPISTWIADANPPFDAEPHSSFGRQRLEAHKNRSGDLRLYLYAQWLCWTASKAALHSKLAPLETQVR